MKINISILISFLFFIQFLFSEPASVEVINLRIREKPNLNSEILAYLTEEDIVEILNVSEKVDTFKIRDKFVSEKWYKIETLAGIKGWVFGGALNKEKVTSKSYKMPKLIGIGDARLWRKSNNKDPKSKSFSLPPWEKIEIIQGSFYLSEPAIGKDITVISKEGFIPAFKSKILDLRVRQDCEQCDTWWEIDIKQVIHPAWKEIRGSLKKVSEYPSDFFIIYPAVEYSKVISIKSLASEDIPENLIPEFIVTAISLTGNKKPDIIEYQFDCKSPKNIEYQTWDYHCTHIYQKNNNQWILIKKLYPL